MPEGDRPEELARSARGAAAQLKLAAELTNIVFWRHDLVTDRLHYNDNGFKVLGIPCGAGGLTLNQARSCVHPDDVPKLTASAAQALLTGDPVDAEIRHRHGDGSWRCMLVRRVVERNAAGAVVAFAGVSLDVTDRHAAAAALHAASERCALITRSAGIGTWETSPEHEDARWDAQMFQLRGPAPQAGALDRDTRFALVYPDDRAHVLGTLPHQTTHTQPNCCRSRRSAPHSAASRFSSTNSAISARPASTCWR